MKVIGVTEFGGPDALAIHDVPEPHAGPGEVRIQVRAFAVSPTDTGVREGGRDLSQAGEPPYVPGMDAAGIVDEVGEGVTEWSTGDEVMAIALPLRGHGGAYVEQLVAPVDSIARIPAGTSFEEASTVPMNGLTAVQILEKAGLSQGQTLVVTGAAGLLGNYVVQLAEQQGIVVIADAADKDRALVESLGADHVVPRGDEFVAAVQAIAPHGVDAVADTALLHEDAVPVLRDGGVFLAVRGWQGNGERGIRFEQAAVFDEYHSQAKLDRLRQDVEDGVLTPRVAEVLPASEPGSAADAHTRLAAGGVRGRFVLVW
ncbi:NADP-dependent oxidoreductase [Curtobacterium sp. Leaf261]|uniref:NADP-dependent oxidoreductase n=1 Tax=Curtobacterium sp. Leaf261 TaxID=1736311 RepID=UPI000700FB4D|nr:NADP-dependent oxidoreductase [Curtobacterium sp. Leaf261]KQO65167.1 alcohol dehydrogenase [Curtobacterium sp. Leaf261]